MSTITTPTSTPTGPLRSTGRLRSTGASRVLVAVVLTVIIGASALLGHLGCQRMREVAPIGSTDDYGRTVTGHTWSLHPAGFTVRFDDGTSATQLWW